MHWDDQDRVAGVVRRVERALAGTVPRRVIEERVRACFAEWGDTLLRADDVPRFVERRTVEELRATSA